MKDPEGSSAYDRGLEKSRASLLEKIRSAIARGKELDEEQLDQVEEALILSDMGARYAAYITSELKKAAQGSDHLSEDQMKRFLAERIADTVRPAMPERSEEITSRPRVIAVVGVNGTGKTTTIGKLAHRFRRDRKSVLLVGADTYRAAADKQLEVWARRSDADFIGGISGRDPAAVVHDALNTARSGSSDIVMIDTAGRLHTKEPLMNELEKICRVASKIVEGAPHEVLLVLDATTGQNALVQARTFTETVGVTGVILTKMDGTARGGILIPVAGELKLPIMYLGMGEGIEDLLPFDPVAYAASLVGEGSS